MKHKLENRDRQTTFYAICTPRPVELTDRAGNVRTDKAGHVRYVTIKPNVKGTLALIDNYILTYRCQRDRAAEGRQYFEVPAFLAVAAGAAAAAFGAPPGVAVGTSAGSALLGQGKNYYAPKDKAKVLSDGIKAMLCIHNEAVGIDGPTIEAISQVQETSGTPAKPPPETPPPQTPPPDTPTPGASGSQIPPGPDTVALQANGSGNDDNDDAAAISVAYDQQYYNMISTALWSVEQVMSDRLSDSGRQFDMSGVLAELDKLKQEAADKEKAATPPGGPANAATPITNAPPPATPPASQINALTEQFHSERLQNFNIAQTQVTNFGKEQVGKTIIQLKSLQPKLDRCVVQAKV